MTEHIAHLQGCTMLWYAEMAELCVRAEPAIKPGLMESLSGFDVTAQAGCSTVVSIGQGIWGGITLELTSSATAEIAASGNVEFTSSGVDKARRVAATGWVQAAEMLVSSDGATCVTPGCGEMPEPKGHSWIGIGEDFRLSARRARRFHKMPRQGAVRETEAVGLIMAP